MDKQRSVYKTMRRLQHPAKHNSFLGCKREIFTIVKNGIPAWIEPKIGAK